MTEKATQSKPENSPAENPAPQDKRDAKKEIGGQAGPEPTRYGDWEKGGRCTDF